MTDPAARTRYCDPALIVAVPTARRAVRWGKRRVDRCDFEHRRSGLHLALRRCADIAVPPSRLADFKSTRDPVELPIRNETKQPAAGADCKDRFIILLVTGHRSVVLLKRSSIAWGAL
jgi:hypothetical protein